MSEKPNIFEDMANEGFARFPEYGNRGGIRLRCPQCRKAIFTGITPQTDWDRMAKAWLPWNKCDCGTENIALSFCGPGVFGFLPEMFRVEQA